jgi:hypothetical protein
MEVQHIRYRYQKNRPCLHYRIPNPGSTKQASATIQSVKGTINSSFENSNDNFELAVTIPKAAEAIIGIPAEKVSMIKLNNKAIWKRGSEIKNKAILEYYGINNGLFYLGFPRVSIILML